jgi:hypothetical protein
VIGRPGAAVLPLLLQRGGCCGCCGCLGCQGRRRVSHCAAARRESEDRERQLGGGLVCSTSGATIGSEEVAWLAQHVRRKGTQGLRFP